MSQITPHLPARQAESEIAIPQFVLRLLANPPLLPNETREEFFQIFEDFTSAIPPQAQLDYYVFFEIAVLTIEVIRYRRMKIAIFNNAQCRVVDGVFRQTDPDVNAKGSVAIAANASRKYMMDPVYRANAAKGFAEAGFNQESIDGESFVRALPDIASIERLIVSAQRRLNASLKNFASHDDRVGTMRATAKRAIDRA